jgi:hypothetical protein
MLCGIAALQGGAEVAGWRSIAVSAVVGGWSVACDGDGEAAVQPMMFLSGARAEAQAHALARRLSDVGEDVQITVRDRASNFIGLTRYPPRSRAAELA